MLSQYDDELPDDVVLAIQRVLDLQNSQNGDPLDSLSTKFDMTGILNSYFPKEESLGQIEAVQARLAQDEIELRAEIEALRAELKRDQDSSRMQLIQETLSELLGQMSRIREKATESEAVVRNITKDIQVLDLAKKNLILSMTTLKRLQMLVNALTQLEELLEEKKYNEIEQSLAAVKQISASFKPYLSVQRVSQLWKRVQDVQGRLRSQLEADFDTFFFQDPSKPIKPALVSDACLVVDVFGADMRIQLLDRYVSLELKDYRRIFRATDEAGQLDNISRRFAWFRRLLLTHETEQGRVFPPEWKVGWYLLARFIEITRDDMTALLSKAGSSLTVKQLLDTLQVTSEFEASMVKKFVTPLQEILDTASAGSSRLSKSISSAFEPHIGIFVDAQDKALADMLAVHRGIKSVKMQSRPSLEATASSSEQDGDTTSSSTIVLPSSTELFYFYGQNLEQCAKLSTGKALFDLCAVHKKWLRIYAEEVLVTSLKRTSAPTRRSAEARVDMHHLKQTCILINTADYCHTTAVELEQKIREKIDEPFKEKISLQVECDMFVSVISMAIMAQLKEIDFACEPGFGTMARMTWANLKQVSGQSAYAGEVVNSVEQVIELVKPLVEQKKYLRNLFDKTCSLILTKFTISLVRSRPLKEIGAEQLLIDLQTIKAYLVKLPGESLTTASYTRALTKNTTRLETLLKVIVTPLDPLEGFILNYTILVGDSSFSNFQKVLDLKGTSKSEQNNVLDSFLTITSTKTELESTSFLSSLDMDPPSLSMNSGNLASPGSSWISLPGMAINGPGSAADSILAALGSPTRNGSSTPTGLTDSPGHRSGEQKREVFQDFRRLMSLGLRRESSQGT